jgi:hypothetical protein
MMRVFIGFDGREAVAFNVLQFSIQARSSRPVSVAALDLKQLAGLLTRKRHPLQSTDFSFSRFLTPYLSAYQGWSIFMDCDMLVLDDIARLYDMRDDRFAVMVVKHEHVPRESKKFLGQLQSKYEKKNWSSVMLFNNARCRALSLEYVNQATGLQLHQFKWVGDDALIGAIPGRWNHLVGYDAPRLDAAIVHYTLGGPYFAEYRDCEYSREWFQERDRMLYAERSRVLSESR